MASQTYSSDKRALQCGCPSKEEDYKSQGWGSRTGTEQVVSTEVTWQSHKGWSNQKLQSLTNKASTMTLPAMVSLSVWWGFNAPNQPSHCKNHSLALSKLEQCEQSESGGWKKPFHSQFPETLFWLWDHNYQGALNASEKLEQNPGLSKANRRSLWAFTEQGAQSHVLVTTPCVNRIWRWFSFHPATQSYRDRCNN